MHKKEIADYGRLVAGESTSLIAGIHLGQSVWQRPAFNGPLLTGRCSLAAAHWKRSAKQAKGTLTVLAFAFVAHELVRLAHLTDPAARLAGRLGDLYFADVARLGASRGGHHQARRPFNVPVDVVQVEFEAEIRPVADALVSEAGGAQVGALKVVDVVAAESVAVLIESYQAADRICANGKTN